MFDNLPPLRERKFKRMRVVWVNGLLHDFNGDFTLQGSSRRGLRLLARLTKSRENLEREFARLAASVRRNPEVKL
jgi:hypothetical protein